MFSMCGTTKYPYLWSKGGYWKFSGEEIFKGQNFRRKYGAKLEFLEAWRRRGEGSIKKTSLGEVYTYILQQDNQSCN